MLKVKIFRIIFVNGFQFKTPVRKWTMILHILNPLTPAAAPRVKKSKRKHIDLNVTSLTQSFEDASRGVKEDLKVDPMAWTYL